MTTLNHLRPDEHERLAQVRAEIQERRKEVKRIYDRARKRAVRKGGV